MNFLLHFLNSEAFHLLGESTSWAELLGFITGALCVWLVAIQHVINWPLGIANSAFFLLLFVTSGLYADSGLQVFYIVLGFYGWWAWLYGGERRSTLRVSRTTGRQWALLVLLSTVGMVGMFELLARATPSTVPFWDALTTILSLAATWGQCRKKVENWWLWIMADIIYIPLYIYKGLWLTSVLYAVFLALCVVGLVAWRKELGTSRVDTSQPVEMLVAA